VGTDRIIPLRETNRKPVERGCRDAAFDRQPNPWISTDFLPNAARDLL
jgi:hypothetical protein